MYIGVCVMSSENGDSSVIMTGRVHSLLSIDLCRIVSSFVSSFVNACYRDSFNGVVLYTVCDRHGKAGIGEVVER